MEMWLNLFEQDDKTGKKPHFKILCRDAEGVEHEAAFWPAKEGKKGYSGKLMPKEAYNPTPHNEAKANAFQPEHDVPAEEIPF